MSATLPPRAVVGRTLADSRPQHPPRVRAPKGAPNVVVIVLDDLGFGQLGCFGSDIATPHIDGLAAEGLRYNRFHVTAMCSPTRAALLTGRNHHAVGMGIVADIPIGFPGYDGRLPRSAATSARLLKDAGWSTFAVGKWHLAPRGEQSASGPFDRWPLGLGFERYYGFLNGDANQWAPELISDNGFVDQPRSPEDGYHLTEDLADRAIRFVLDQQHATPDKPFFLYLATGAMHAPHHAPRSYIDRYAGAFDQGWEAWREALFARQVASGVVPAGTTLTPRPSWVQPWDELPAEHRRLFARYMEVFAGFLTHTDEQIGRFLGMLATMGILDDTLVLLISDNGTSGEGGPIGSFNELRFTHDRLDDIDDSLARIDEIGGHTAYNHYPWGWAWAGNSPLRLWKRFTWLGGVRTPLVVRWPRGFEAAGEVRSQFCHAVDLFSTVLDACGVAVPAQVDGVDQQPVDGASIRPTFDDPDAGSPRRTQYFELLGSRSLYHDGWKVTTDHVGRSLSIETELVEGSNDFETDRWCLFDLDADFSEAHDLADEHPERARALAELWWAEAGRNGVLPLEDGLLTRAGALVPPTYRHRHRLVLRPGGGGVAEDHLGPLGAGFRLRAPLSLPDGAANGIVCALGDWTGGWALYLLDGRPVAAFAIFSHTVALRGEAPVAAGDHELGLDYDPGEGRRLRLLVDGAQVAEATLVEDLPFRWQIGGAALRLGRDVGLPVTDDYRPPFALTGTLHHVSLEFPILAPRDATRAEDERTAKVLRTE